MNIYSYLFPESASQPTYEEPSINAITKKCLIVSQNLHLLAKNPKDFQAQKNIISANQKFPLTKLPDVILCKIFEFEGPEEWIQKEQTSKKLNGLLTKSKVWEKEAHRLGLEFAPGKAKETVLEFYHFLPKVNDLLFQASNDEVPQEIMAIVDSLKRSLAIAEFYKANYKPPLVDQFTSALTFNNMDRTDLRLRMHLMVWAIQTGFCTQKWLLETGFSVLALIPDPKFARPILLQAIKKLPQFEKMEIRSPLTFYLNGKTHDADIALRLVDKYKVISSSGLRSSFLRFAYEKYKDQPEPCKVLLKAIIKKGDRLVGGDKTIIPEDIVKFIEAEVQAAEKGNKS